MTRDEYIAKRKTLMDAARNAVGDKEAFDKAKKEVEDLDEQYKNEITNQANLDALNNVVPPVNPLVDLGHAPADKPKETEDIHATNEYRHAFMDYVQHNTPLPDQFKNAAVMTTGADAGAVIPTTIMSEIISELKSRGNVYAKVRKLNVQGGVEFPISTLKPTASWVTETAPSADQKLEAKTSVSFSYYGLEVKVAQSLLVSVVSLQAFEDMFTTAAVDAILAALEIGVFKGTGSGQMTGICVDSRIPSANIIELAAADLTWANLKKKVFAKMKKAYRKGDFWMAQGTFDAYIDGMVDTTGQPIGRVNYGTDGEEIYRFGGKTVETVEDDVIASFDDAATGEVFAVFADLNQYAINSNMEMTTVKWVDHDTNEVKNQIMLIADGKILDPNGVIILKKKATA